MAKKAASTPESAPATEEPIIAAEVTPPEPPETEAAAPTPEAEDKPEGEPPAEGDAPKTMLEAVERGLDASKKDEKPEAEADKKPEAKPAEKPKPEDLTVMPEGLKPDGQERFRKLANSNKELNSKLEASEGTLNEFQGIMAEHGVQQQQFEQAVGFLGLVNRGDLDGARAILERELRNIAMLQGKPIGTLDALTDYPDLRNRVDSLEIDEPTAHQLARARFTDDIRNRQAESQQEARQQQQEETQSRQEALQQIDVFLTQQSKHDMDFTRKEQLISKRVVELCKTVPPAAWLSTVKQAYELVGDVVAAPTPEPGTKTLRPLRPNAGGGGKPAPKNLFEAMWNT